MTTSCTDSENSRAAVSKQTEAMDSLNGLKRACGVEAAITQLKIDDARTVKNLITVLSSISPATMDASLKPGLLAACTTVAESNERIHNTNMPGQEVDFRFLEVVLPFLPSEKRAEPTKVQQIALVSKDMHKSVLAITATPGVDNRVRDPRCDVKLKAVDRAIQKMQKLTTAALPTFPKFKDAVANRLKEAIELVDATSTALLAAKRLAFTTYDEANGKYVDHESATGWHEQHTKCKTLADVTALVEKQLGGFDCGDMIASRDVILKDRSLLRYWNSIVGGDSIPAPPLIGIGSPAGFRCPHICDVPICVRVPS